MVCELILTQKARKGPFIPENDKKVPVGVGQILFGKVRKASGCVLYFWGFTTSHF